MKKSTKHLVIALILFLSAHTVISATNCDALIASAGRDTSICTSYIQLYAASPEFGIGQWTIVSGQGSGTFINNTDPKTTVVELSKGANVFVWSVTNNTCIARDTVIILNNSPSQADAGFDQLILGTITSMNANLPIFGTGSWSILSGSASFANITNPNSSITDLHVGANKFLWTIDNFGCVSFATVTITKDIFIAADAGFDQEICNNETALKANSPEAGSYGEWSVIKGSGSFDDINYYASPLRYIGKGRNVYRWTIQSQNYSSADTVVIINNQPTTADAGIDTIITENDFNLKGNIPHIGIGKWTLMSGGGNFSDVNNPNATIYELNPGQNILRWTITNGYCVSKDDVVVTKSLTTQIRQNSSECEASILQSNNSELIINGDCIIDSWELTSISGLKLASGNNCYSSNIAIAREQFRAGIYLIRITYKDGTTIIKKTILT